jgi:hypothetical protein
MVSYNGVAQFVLSTVTLRLPYKYTAPNRTNTLHATLHAESHLRQSATRTNAVDCSLNPVCSECEQMNQLFASGKVLLQPDGISHAAIKTHSFVKQTSSATIPSSLIIRFMSLMSLKLLGRGTLFTIERG